ncbi:MAG: lactate utilization protein [Oscillospiraceae bacterium]|nr:lactate utilization protein [Oscillospiraceae bacterium]
MDQHLRATIEKRIHLTVEALRKNRFEAHYLPTKADLPEKVREIMPAGASCSVGGSVTLTDTGILSLLGSGDYHYLDRYAPGIDVVQVMIDALSCDVYFTGTNAVTMDGRLYNIDGRGNRLAAICFGPRKVIVVAGYNKIVEDIPAAQTRLRHFAAPANSAKLGFKTPCAVTGICQDCASPERICSQELVTGWQREPGRICVLILGEEYGY